MMNIFEPDIGLNTDSNQALILLKNSLFLLYQIYKPYFKVIGLLILSYIGYRIGKLTVRDTVQSKQRKLTSLIAYRNSAKFLIPRRLIQTNTAQKIIGFFIFIAVLLTCILLYLGIPKYSKFIQYAVPFLGLLFFIFIGLVIEKIILKIKMKNNRNLQKQITDEAKQLLQLMGPKVAELLKNQLCHEKIISNVRQKSNQCRKKNCQEIRKLYHTRNQAITQLVQQVLQFQWCSICNKRNKFDQLLPYEAKGFIAQIEGEAEVSERVKYLLNEIERMIEWIKLTNPCNCTKLYWNLSTEEIMKYRKVDKQVDTSIKELEKQISRPKERILNKK